MAKEKAEEKGLESLDQIEADATGAEEHTGGDPETDAGGEPSPAAPKKVRKKRKKKEPEPEPELSQDETSAMLGWVFTAIAERAGEHWKLTKKEADHGAIVINRVMLKYMPVVGKYSEELALLMWSVTVVLPRWQISGQTKPEPALE